MTDTPIGYFLQGHASAEAGQPETANPLLFDAWPHQAWLAGHRFYVEYASARVMEHDGPLERVDVAPREQGRIAQGKGRPLEACPYEPESQDYRRWRLGWLERFNETTSSWDSADADEWDRNCSARRWACFSYLAFLAIVVAGIVWAYMANRSTPTKASRALIECQRHNPPWKTGECR